MRAPAIPADERERMRRLQALDVLFTPASQAYDEVTRLARLRFGTAFALVSLVTEDEQWFKSADGLDACSTSREVSFCGHAIHGDKVFVVEDATQDERFADNPLVTGPPNIRFYAGYPLRTGPGSALGTLCIIDTEPRSFGESECSQLSRLGHLAENLLREREQVLDLAADVLAQQRGISRWDLVEPITGNWTFEAAGSLVEPAIVHARQEQKQICLVLIDLAGAAGSQSLAEDPQARMILKEAARKLRATLPPLSVHFHDGRGKLVSIGLSSSLENGYDLGHGAVREFQSASGWDLLNLEPPACRKEVSLFEPTAAGAADDIISYLRPPA